MMKQFCTILLLLLIIFAGQKTTAQSPTQSDVFMQGFYWNSPPGGVWYDSLAKLAPRISSAGFAAVWFPSAVKGGGGSFSMGYDPYDHYDFGDYNQKGTVETRFGSKAELKNSISIFHNLGVQVFADAVLNHMQGGEKKVGYQCRPAGTPDSAFISFTYPFGSGRFQKDSSFFYPNAIHCDVNPPYHGPTDPIYKFGDWLDKEQPRVRDSLIAWGQYLKTGLGFDGFRLDAVKNIDPNFIGNWLKSANSGGYAVAELWSGVSDIQWWLGQALSVAGSSVAMFDFPLRYSLQDMCNNTSGTYDMRSLDGAGLINAGSSGYNVATFVENHDFDRTGFDGTTDNGHNPIITNKDMAYAYTIFSEGRPCVFFKDYFTYGFSGKIDTLIWIRAKFLGGGTSKRGDLASYGIRQDGNSDQNTVGPDFYVARRNGFGAQKGGYLLINDNATQWMDVWVNTNEAVGAKYKDYTGRDANKTVVGPSVSGGPNRVKLWAPPRSYTVYVADTTQSINYPPVISPVADKIAYTNTPVSLTVLAGDANNTVLTYALINSPAWLTISSTGVVAGTPTMADTGKKNIIVKVSDPLGLFAVDTFAVTVVKNFSPKLTVINDTISYATKRIELQARATDADSDTLQFGFTQAPAWFSIGQATGSMSGTPALADTGIYNIRLYVSDSKGGFDSLGFKLTVKKAQDSVIHTFGKPAIDGTINVGTGDWLSTWQIAVDPDTDSRWRPVALLDNEILGLFATWDADSLYLGVKYVINDSNNTMMVYLDAGLPGGWTNFNSNQGYNGAYPKNNRFRTADGIDFFIADYFHNKPSFFKDSANASVNITPKTNGARGTQGKDLEFAVAWNDVYKLGAGKIPSGVKLKIVALVAGGDNWGSGDACPDNPDVDGNAGPDSLVNFATISPDTNNDGFPDPTITSGGSITSIAVLAGWNILSAPINATTPLVSVVFPGANSPAYAYNNGYTTFDTMKIGKGFWLRYPSATSVPFPGTPDAGTSIPLAQGWNLIGGQLSDITVANISTTPPGIISSFFYGFESGYSTPTVLKSGKGYWIRTSAAGTMSTVASFAKSGDAKIPAIENDWAKISIIDREGNKSILYAAKKGANLNTCELPPVPPAGIFDARFSSQRGVEVLGTESKTILLHSAEYPVAISVEGMELRVIDKPTNGKLVNSLVKNGGSISITNSSVSAIEVQSFENPVTYELLQNYPNPFNPSTTIKFALPEKANVTLTVYNQIGEKIADLVNGRMESGYHSVLWNAQNIASGVYFYQLKAGSFISVKKLILLK